MRCVRDGIESHGIRGGSSQDRDRAGREEMSAAVQARRQWRECTTMWAQCHGASGSRFTGQETESPA